MAVCALDAACGKAPAEQALKAADAALEAARPDVEKYVPAVERFARQPQLLDARFRQVVGPR